MAASMDYRGTHLTVLLLLLTVVMTVLPLPQGSGQLLETNPDQTPSNTTIATPGSTPPTAAPAVSTVTSSRSCRKPGVKYPIGINYEELRQALEADTVLLIDVRNRWELEETGKLPRSVNLPQIDEAIKLSEDEFMRKYGFPKPLPEATNVVLTCRSGRRVQVAWKKLEPLGYCNVRLYFGSYLDWKARNGPLIPVHRAS